jgi:hypothetical protein
MMQIYEGKYAYLHPSEEMRLHRDQYYYQSVVFRSLQLLAIARTFEAEAFYINADQAGDGDSISCATPRASFGS